MNGLELFAGGGGWSTGHRMARPFDTSIGVEIDSSACATARAAGHHRIQSDVTSLDPFMVESIFGPFEFAHMSPVCRGFSLSGHGMGRRDGDAMLSSLNRMKLDDDPDRIRHLIDEFDILSHDHRSHLTLEPLYWIAALRPAYITMEQVRQVLPVWRAAAGVLESWGYSVAVGVLHTEQFGVPQTRARAILVAQEGNDPVSLPTPTHSKFHSTSPEKLDRGVMPWVSMRDALSGNDWGGPTPEHLRWGTPDRKAAIRHIDEPAPTIMFGNDSASKVWVYPDVRLRSNYSGGPGRTAQERGRTYRSLDQPSVTITGKPPSWDRGDFFSRTPNDAFRISVLEAGILQSFPVDYPWHGGQTSRYQQIGDAVPPLLARAVVAELMGSEDLI